MNTENIKCKVKEEFLYIENVKPGTNIQVFTGKGILYRQIIAGNKAIKIFLEAPGMYLVIIQLQANIFTCKVIRQ